MNNLKEAKEEPTRTTSSDGSSTAKGSSGGCDENQELKAQVASLQQQNDPGQFVTAFAGDDRYVADYLMEEVIRQQPENFKQKSSQLKKCFSNQRHESIYS